ncbi:TonB protein C-terminal [Chitinophaga rupis]|uniref:TonB protein C-terminal n=1 Tax=Chitinophaga rupis TaxID=573321 RepID=A0A1H8K8L6_9BACT|nr:energy transducer TonB [Chitinophaga rupis]SEN89340.1 TonB protein C-terminal [Chitinophaga rupis]
MKGCLIIIFSFFVGTSATHAQKREQQDCISLYDSTFKQKIYVWVDKMPQYGEGTTDILTYFSAHFHELKDPDNFQGSIKMEFIVTEKGALKGPKIMNKAPGEITVMEKEALKIFSTMPRWKPGTCKGKAVPVKMQLPIVF